MVLGRKRQKKRRDSNRRILMLKGEEDAKNDEQRSWSEPIHLGENMRSLTRRTGRKKVRMVMLAELLTVLRGRKRTMIMLTKLPALCL
jgi:hypothetical protein